MVCEGRNKRTDVTFTVKREDLDKSVNLIKKNSNLKFEKITFDDKVAKVSIVGAGMITHPGVAFKMGVFSGEMREKGCLMSGAAARTGDLKK